MSSVQHVALSERAQRQAPAWVLRSRVVRQVALQELRDALFSWPLYVAAAVGLVLAVLLIYNSLSFVATSKLLVMSRPFYLPLLAIAMLAMLYVIAWSILSIARSRDQGALRVLFFAPVDPAGLLGGHLLAGAAIYALMMLLATPLLVVLGWLTNVPFPPLLLLGALVTPVFALVAVSIGLFISSIASTSRSALFAFVGLVLLVLGVQGGYRALLSVPPTSTYYDALLFVRVLLRTISMAFDWVSPVALLSGGLDAALRANWPDLLLRAGAALVGSAVWLWLAVWGLGRRGVLP
ncbi:MAG TPA: ABC transporter permease subunit [Roseiflexaceae bacterium]|nr:ABC transporter permease subunit [Roseiflexaceae bacterium]